MHIFKCASIEFILAWNRLETINSNLKIDDLKYFVDKTLVILNRGLQLTYTDNSRGWN